MTNALIAPIHRCRNIEPLPFDAGDQPVPLSCAQTAGAQEPPLAEGQPLFPNARGGNLSSHGVHYLLNKHVRTAAVKCSSLNSKRVSPHVLRHTTAMDPLQEGVERSNISMWLGHESIETTQIYLDADLAMKQAVNTRAEASEIASRYWASFVAPTACSPACEVPDKVLSKKTVTGACSWPTT